MGNDLQTVLLLYSAFPCIFRFFGLSSSDTVTTLVQSHLASFLPFSEVIPAFICVFAAFLMAFAAQAQEKMRSVSLEVFGAQNTVGINYDSRFKGNDGWGWRVGLGFGYGDNSGFIDQNIKGVGVPLEVNYLLGKKSSKLELGFGANFGFYHVKEKTGYYFPLGDGSGDKTEYYKSSDNRFGYLMFGNIGYRYQRVSGFMFRVGITPSFNFGDKNGLKKSAACPYIGLGWSF